MWRRIEKFNHWCKTFNIYSSTIKFPKNATRQQTNIYVHSRIGHTKLTHQHLLLGNASPICHYCSIPLTPNHILQEYGLFEYIRHRLFLQNNPLDILKLCKLENLIILENFITNYRDNLISHLRFYCNLSSRKPWQLVLLEYFCYNK